MKSFYLNLRAASALILVCCLSSISTLHAQTALETRSVSNTSHCGNGYHYGTWLNLSGIHSYYTLSDATFTEYTDGTARLNGKITNNSNSHITFTVEATFSGRTYTAPDSNSPKSNECYYASTNDWYYYSQTAGYFYGTDNAAGATIEFDRKGASFQVGTGANVTDGDVFGASGWLNLNIISQPYNSSLTLSGDNGDFNFLLSGSALPECSNLTYGGKIGDYEVSAESFDPSEITSLESPSGGMGNIEYLWLSSSDPTLPWSSWTQIANSNSPTYDPGSIHSTTYYLRCARREGCSTYDGESNIIAKIVNGTGNNCDNDAVIVKNQVTEVISNTGVDNQDEILGAIDENSAKFYDNGDELTIKLAGNLNTGQNYTISWKGRNYTSAYATNPRLQVYESEDNVTFTLNTTLENTINYFLSHQTLTAVSNVRYIKLVNPSTADDGSPDFEVDAISYSNYRCQNTNPQGCALSDYGPADYAPGTRNVWLNFDIDGIKEYTAVYDGATFTQLADGTALIEGTVENITDDCDRWQFSVRLLNKRNWADWSALGGSYKANTFVEDEDHTTWSYYELDEDNSAFTGLGCNAGKAMSLTTYPSTGEYGFQVGYGANVKDSDYGLSGWYNFSGDFSGRGDFNSDLENCAAIPNNGRIGDVVWEDLNGNGVKEDGEPAVPGAFVFLEDENGNAVPDVMYQITDADGKYAFENLPAGSYRVRFATPAGYLLTDNDLGGNDNEDSDANLFDGKSDLIVLGANGEDLSIDAGYVKPVKIGNRIWSDDNGNGLQDDDEVGVNGIVVKLVKPGDDGEYGTYDDIFVASQTTMNDGEYVFGEVRASTYAIQIDLSSLPNTFILTGNDMGDDDKDSDFDPETGFSEPFTVLSGQVADLSFDGGLEAIDPLPVDLIRFDAVLQKNNQTLLTWATASEDNNNFFLVQRSADGERYETIGTIEGQGTTSNTNYYQLIDESPYAGRNYYRLKQVDFDGKFAFSQIELVILENDNLADVIAYPNPTKDFTTLRVVNPLEGEAQIEVINAFGQILKTQKVAEGANNIEVDLSDYRAGYYFIHINYNGFQRIVHRVSKIQD